MSSMILSAEGKQSGVPLNLFYKRVYTDDALRPFFKTTDMAQLAARQSMFISMLLGGRVVYTGKDIHAAHAHAREQGLNAVRRNLSRRVT